MPTGLTDFTRNVIEGGLPDPPEWVGKLPLIGERAVDYWASFAHDGAGLLVELKRLVDPLREFGFKAGAVVGDGLLQLTLSVLIAFFFYPRRRSDHGARARRGEPHCADARPAHARGRGCDDARRRVRHSRHGARAGRADGDRSLHRRHQGGAAARPADVLPVAGAGRARRWYGFRSGCISSSRRARPRGASSCWCGARWSCRRSTTC